MTLTAGVRLGPYEILAPIGAGGMGEVYRARDTRLDRTVAVKVLPAHVAGRPEVRQRFEREARAVSSLNHPHICTLYDIGQQDGINFLVMEYLEGETLAVRLTKGPLPVAQAIRHAIEITDALAQAHRQGVFHRDLKPANIMLTKAGAKLLDFGLAKLREAAPQGDAARTALATLSQDLTQQGTILGTLQYMAPEQLEGKETDSRTDIFAFGAVLYEMVTGRKAFEGRSQASLISSIMTSEPAPVSTVEPGGGAPPALDHVVRTCLTKDPEARWQTAQDVLAQLKWIAEAGSQAGIPKPVMARRKTRERIAWALLAVVSVAALALAVVHFSERPPQFHPIRFTIPAPDKVTFQWYDIPTVSPDGRRVVFAGTTPDGKRLLWLRSLESITIQSLPGTEGAYLPFWSPDSRSIGFFADGKLKRIDISGGPPQALGDASSAGGDWNREGVILFVPGGRRALHRIAAAGGEAKPVLDLDKSRQEISHLWPRFLPDGRHFLYLARGADAGNTGIYVGSLDSKETRLVIRADSNTSYSPPGFLLFARQETLLAQPFDGKKLQITGEPFPIAEQVGRMAATPGALFSASDTGALVYRAGASTNVQLAWYNRDGKRLGPIGEPGTYRQIVLSPDGKRLSVERIDPKTARADLWTLELASGIFSRLTLDPADDQDAVWSPDGRELFFTSNRKGRNNLYRKAVGGGEDELVFESADPKYAEEWLKDGTLLFISQQGKSLYRLPLAGERKPVLLSRTEFDRDEPHVSPDGRWVAYNSNESGRWEVYIAAFPSFTDRRQVSNAGGCQPRWGRDGKELFYLSLEGKLMALAIKPGPALEPGIPEPLFQVRMRVSPTVDQYGVTGDGKRFIFGESIEEGEKPIHVVLNWPAVVKP